MISRRTLLGTAALGAIAGASPLLDRGAVAAAPPPLPAPADSGIDHIVVCMMENRSFDHFLGWLPGADGRQAGLSYVDRSGARHATHHLTRTASCGLADPDHSYEGGRIELDDGRCDGWLKAGENDSLAIGYYAQADLPFIGKAAPYWTTCERYFSAVMAETYPNRFYQHAGQTDRLHNSTTISTLPTIWDRCKAAGVSATYYFSDIPFLALWGTRYLDVSQPFAAFEAAAAAGTLPQVSFVDPSFLGESDGVSGDDHPHGDIRAGEHFLSRVYKAVTTGPSWGRTLLVVNFDEWGGFFDHVAPGTAPDVSPTTALRGFRVPAVVVSPRARRHFVAPWTYDHTSILRAIEWRFRLPSLTPRDRSARNIAEVLDFTRPPSLSHPVIDAPPVVVAPCEAQPSGQPSAENEWTDLKTLALKNGWTLP